MGKSNLEDLSSNDAVDASGNSYNSDNYRDNNPFVAGRKIFSELKMVGVLLVNVLKIRILNLMLIE